MTQAVWSKPYYGVSHATVCGRQCTVEQYATFVKAVVFPVPGTTRSFWSSALEREFASVEEAKAWAERAARPV